jgi:hypothetical protein
MIGAAFSASLSMPLSAGCAYHDLLDRDSTSVQGAYVSRAGSRHMAFMIKTPTSMKVSTYPKAPSYATVPMPTDIVYLQSKDYGWQAHSSHQPPELCSGINCRGSAGCSRMVWKSVFGETQPRSPGTLAGTPPPATMTFRPFMSADAIQHLLAGIRFIFHYVINRQSTFRAVAVLETCFALISPVDYSHLPNSSQHEFGRIGARGATRRKKACRTDSQSDRSETIMNVNGRSPGLRKATAKSSTAAGWQ